MYCYRAMLDVVSQHYGSGDGDAGGFGTSGGASVDDDVIQFGVPCVRFNRFMMGFVVLVIRFFRWFMVAG